MLTFMDYTEQLHGAHPTICWFVYCQVHTISVLTPLHYLWEVSCLNCEMRRLNSKCGAKLRVRNKKKGSMDAISAETVKQVHFNSFNNQDLPLLWNFQSLKNSV